MTKQKTLEPEEEYQTPLEVLLSFLRIPNKTYRSIYISILERRLSTKPLIQNEISIAYLANQAGIEPDRMGEKIRSIVKMGWVELEQVGNKDANQIFVLSPIWRYKEGIDEGAFAIALRKYHLDTKEDKEQKKNTKEIFKLMNGICLHTLTKRDTEICELGRWPECETCNMRNKEKDNDE